MKKIKLFEEFVGEAQNIQKTAKDILNTLDKNAQLYPDFEPKEALKAIESGLKKGKDAAKQIRLNLEDIGILANALSPLDVESLIMSNLNESKGLELVHAYDKDGTMYGTGELIKKQGSKTLVRFDSETEKWFDSKDVKLVESKYNGNIAGDAAEYIAKELSHYVKGIIDQSNDAVTYFHLKNKSDKSKVIKTLRDIYGLDAQDGATEFSPSPTIKFDNGQILESNTINEAQIGDKLTKKFTELTGISTWDKVTSKSESGTWTVARLWAPKDNGGMNPGLHIELTKGSTRTHFQAMDEDGTLTQFGKELKKK